MSLLRPSLLAVALVAALAACTQEPAPAPTPAAPEGAATPAAPAEVSLISRQLLFGNPSKAGGQISDDGRWVAYLAPDQGVMNLWIAPSDKPAEAKVITQDRKRGIRIYGFAPDNQHVFFMQDVGGDENFQVFSVNLSSGEQRELTPPKVRAEIVGSSARKPGELMVMLNERNEQFMDLARIDLETGKREVVLQNDAGYVSFTLDNDNEIRLAARQTAEGGTELFKHLGDGKFESYTTIPQTDALTTNSIGFTDDGKTLYMIDSRERDTGALYAIDWESGNRTLVHEHAKADVSDALLHPTTGVVQAVASNYLKSEWSVVDESIRGDLDTLRAKLGDGEIWVSDRTLDDSTWVVAYLASDKPSRTYIYRRAEQSLTEWFASRPDLEGTPLAKMRPVEIPARDGLTLVSYYTLPPQADANQDGKADQASPMVLLVHGGPWARDAYGFNGSHQWLANRGYVVLSVNFRGSTGFGKSFVNAGDREWAAKMHDDLLDAVDWAVQQGIAQKDKVAIMGGSYGGYATLVGLTFTPTTFACGVDIVGPSNLNTLLATIPPYWKPMMEMFATRVGDPRTEEGRAFLESRSPLNFVDKIERPLLIGQGANDPRVKQSEADQIVAAMQAKNIPVTYVLYPDEGHGFARPENRLSFNAVTESFLGTCLGGRVEPVGDDFQGASISVPTGAEHLAGLQEALATVQPSSKP